MSASLIRSRAMVTHVIDRHRWTEITDGAVLQGCGARSCCCPEYIYVS